LAAYLVSSIQPLGRVGPLTNLNLIQRIRDSGEPAKQPEFKYGAQIQLCASDWRRETTLILCGDTAGGSGQSSSAAAVKRTVKQIISIGELRTRSFIASDATLVRE